MHTQNMPRTKTPSVKKAPAAPKKKYHILAKFNGEAFDFYTNDIEKGLLSIKPDQLLTDSFFTVIKGEDESERHLSLMQGRRVFQDDFYREVFINNLLLS